MNKAKKAVAALCLFALVQAAGRGQGLPSSSPEEAGLSSGRLMSLDVIIGEALARRDFPGAVVLVGKNGKVVFRKAYGFSQRVPREIPMTPGMIFDLASLTKPVATATSVIVLVERGRIRLWDKVKDYIPEFTPYVRADGSAGEDARLFHLLTHTSGLPPYTDPGRVEEKYGRPCPTDVLARHIAGIRKRSAAGEAFTYSCLNYITLAEIIKKASGLDVAEFSACNIFRPLGMSNTFYCPPREVIENCVPTEIVDGTPLRGVVHDPLARLQGGISGNAGLFSTADDLAVFCQMLLNGGEFGGVRILSPLAVARMTEIFPKTEGAGRGFGWDLASDYATVRGDLFGYRSYGHSGYTGTSLWIDPDTTAFVIFLTNRVHPDDKGEIIALRSKVANVVAGAILDLRKES